MTTYTIKANNTEYRLLVNVDASLHTFAEELKDFAIQLMNMPKSQESFQLIIDSGNRILPFEYKQLYKEIIQSRSRWDVTFTSNVLTQRQAIKWHKETAVRVEFKTIEAGDVLDVVGDVLLVGDIHPGGYIRATGNIYIIGCHDGVAYAGTNGNPRAVIVGTFSTNSEIRIAQKPYSIRHTLDEKSFYTPRVYYVNDDGELDVAAMKEIETIRPEIDTMFDQLHLFEGDYQEPL